MMDISEDLKNMVMGEVRKTLPFAEKAVSRKRFTSAFCMFPILIDGVVDSIRYNVKEQRFDKVGIHIAIEGTAFHRPIMTKNAVYCDKTEIVYIDI